MNFLKEIVLLLAALDFLRFASKRKSELGFASPFPRISLITSALLASRQPCGMP